MIDVNRVRHSLVLWGPSILAAWYRTPTDCGDWLRVLVTVRCLLPCPLSHWVVGRLFNFFPSVLPPRTKDSSSTRLGHICIRRPAHAYKTKSGQHSAPAIPSKNRAAALPLISARSLFISLLTVVSLPTCEALIYPTSSCVFSRRKQPHETTPAFSSCLLPYLCHVPVSLQPDASEVHLT